MRISNPFRYMKYVVQRITRGYSDKNMWNADMYLAGMIADTLEWFLHKSSGVPMTFAYGLDEYDPDVDIMIERRKQEYEKYIPIFREYSKNGLAWDNKWKEKFGGVLDKDIQDALSWFNKQFSDLWD